MVLRAGYSLQNGPGQMRGVGRGGVGGGCVCGGGQSDAMSNDSRSCGMAHNTER